MNRITQIGHLLKRIQRGYQHDLIVSLQAVGFIDLRPSFLDILACVADHESPTIKEIGQACSLKKQTMTSHINELVKRGYLHRQNNPADKRAFMIRFTEYGERFRVAYANAISELEEKYLKSMGEIQLERLYSILKDADSKLHT